MRAAAPTSWVGFIVYVYRFFTSFFYNSDSEDEGELSSSSHNRHNHDENLQRTPFAAFEALDENATYVTWFRHMMSDAFYALFLDWEDSSDMKSEEDEREFDAVGSSVLPAADPSKYLFGYELPSRRRMLMYTMVTLALMAFFVAKLYVFYRKATAPTHQRRHRDSTPLNSSSSSRTLSGGKRGVFAWIRDTPLCRLFGANSDAGKVQGSDAMNGTSGGAEDGSGAASALSAHTTHLQTLLMNHGGNQHSNTTTRTIDRNASSAEAKKETKTTMTGKTSEERREDVNVLDDDTQWNVCNEKLITALPAEDRVTLRNAMPLFSFFAALCGDHRFDPEYRVHRWSKRETPNQHEKVSPQHNPQQQREDELDPNHIGAAAPAWSKMHAELRHSVSPLVLSAMMRAVQAQYGTRIAAVPFETVTVKESNYTAEERKKDESQTTPIEGDVPMKIVNCVALLYFERSAPTPGNGGPRTVVAVDADTVEDITTDFSNDYLLHGLARPAIGVQCQASWIEYRGGCGAKHETRRNVDEDDSNSWAPWYIRDLKRCSDACVEQHHRFRITRFLMRPFVTTHNDTARTIALSSSLDVLQYLKGADLQPFVERFLTLLFTPKRVEEAVGLLLPELQKKYSAPQKGKGNALKQLQETMHHVVKRCGGIRGKEQTQSTHDAPTDAGALELIYVASRTVRTTQKDMKDAGRDALENAGPTPSHIHSFELRYVVCGVKQDVDVDVTVVVRDLQCYVSKYEVLMLPDA